MIHTCHSCHLDEWTSLPLRWDSWTSHRTRLLCFQPDQSGLLPKHTDPMDPCNQPMRKEDELTWRPPAWECFTFWGWPNAKYGMRRCFCQHKARRTEPSEPATNTRRDDTMNSQLLLGVMQPIQDLRDQHHVIEDPYQPKTKKSSHMWTKNIFNQPLDPDQMHWMQPFVRQRICGSIAAIQFLNHEYHSEFRKNICNWNRKTNRPINDAGI